MSSKTSGHWVHHHCLSRYSMILRVFEVAYPEFVWSFLLLSQNPNPNTNPNLFPPKKKKTKSPPFNHLKFNTFFTARQQKPSQISKLKKEKSNEAAHVRLLKSKLLPQDSSTKQEQKNPLDELPNFVYGGGNYLHWRQEQSDPRKP